jgi:hypothetical protein
MDKFILFKFRPDILERIKKSKPANLQEYEFTKKEIALLWTILNDVKDPSKIQTVYNFLTPEFLKDAKQQYIEDYNALAKKQQQAEQKYIKFLDKAEPEVKEYSPFIISRNNIVITFDDLQVQPTYQIPMVRSKEYIKLMRGYTDYKELEEFFKGDETEPTYIFKIPSVDKGKIFDNRIEVPTDPKDTERIVETIKTSFHLENAKWHKEYINGEFVIPDTTFDWNVMAMLLVNNHYFNNLIFLVESGEVLSLRERFTLKYHKYGIENGMPIFYTLSNVKNDLVIKIAKIPDEKEIQESIQIILYVITEYIEHEENIIEQYKKYIPTFKTKAKAKKVAQKEYKTKVRLEALQRLDPVMFGGDYNKKCQGPSKQPRIPTKKEAEKLLKSKPDEIIEFPYGSGIYYTCEPFEKPGKKSNKYPGLVKNGDSYVPCCYPLSHHKRPNSYLNKYIAEQLGQKERSVVEKRIIDNLLGEEKRLPEFRRGRLPERLAYILKFLGLKPQEYFRFGVPHNNQSVIDAMAMISNSDWFKEPDKYRKQVVKKLQSSNILSAAAQSYTTSYLREALANPGLEIGAAEFHPVVEYFFKSTVLVIREDDLARPASKFGFIAHLRKRKSMIILYMHAGHNQVEVIGTLKRDFTDYPETAITAALELKRQCFAFYSADHFVFPRIAEISNRASHQYIDSFGKNRGFLVDGQTIFMPPSAPTAKPIIDSLLLFHHDTSRVLAKTGEEALYYKDGLVYSAKFVLPTDDDDYKTLPEPPEDFVPSFIVATSNFIKDSIAVEEKAKPNPFVHKLDIDPPDVLTIYPQDEAEYLKIVKELPAFKWEKLANLIWNPGQLHWVTYGTDKLLVRDVEYKPAQSDKEIGTWNVMKDDKVSDEGQYIEYPDNKFGVVMERL